MSTAWTLSIENTEPNEQKTYPRKLWGHGDIDKILYDAHNLGMGDAILSMPALYQKIQDGNKITVWGSAFLRKCFQSLETSYIVSGGFVSAEYFRTLYIPVNHAWIHAGLTHFEKYAEILETTLPVHFDFAECLIPNAPTSKREGVIVALSSCDTIDLPRDILKDNYSSRSYPLQKQNEILHLLGNSLGNVHVIGDYETKQGWYDSFQELCMAVHHARLVIAVDTGTMHVALALGTPCVALFGPSREEAIAYPYSKYRDISNFRVVRSTKEYEDRMIPQTKDITPEQVMSAVNELM